MAGEGTTKRDIAGMKRSMKSRRLSVERKKEREEEEDVPDEEGDAEGDAGVEEVDVSRVPTVVVGLKKKEMRETARKRVLETPLLRKMQ